VSGAEGDPPRLSEVLRTPGQGRVLVAEGGGVAARHALVGEKMAALAIENGWAGIVLDGLVRDVAVLRVLPIAVFALGSIPSRPAWAETVRMRHDLPLRFLDALFEPGHWLYADEDGIVLAPHALGA